MTVTNRNELVDWLEARSQAAPPLYKASYQKLAHAVKRMPIEMRNRKEQVKLAEAIGDLDRMSGLDRHYDRKLPDPLRTVFNTTKVAGPGVTLAGQFVPMERLAAHDANFYSDILGPDIVREAADRSGNMDPGALAQILETLPADMQRTVVAKMR